MPLGLVSRTVARVLPFKPTPMMLNQNKLFTSSATILSLCTSKTLEITNLVIKKQTNKQQTKQKTKQNKKD